MLAVAECRLCATTFEYDYLGGRMRRYCSSACRHQAARAQSRSSARASYERRKNSPPYKANRLGYDQRRRARKRTTEVEVFSSAEIFARDRYRCHICKVKCRPNVAVPHRLAPTLDHLIPLAEGGEHTHANTATACFQCNSVKGDRGGGEQLAIV